MDLKYIAGFFDGEGSVGIIKIKRKGNPFYVLKVRINNINKNVLKQIKSQFWGSIVKKSNKKYSRPNHSICWIWITTTNKALFFLKTILPHLIVKKRQAELGIKFQTYEKKNYRLSKEDLNFREKCYQKMKELNKRGKL